MCNDQTRKIEENKRNGYKTKSYHIKNSFFFYSSFWPITIKYKGAQTHESLYIPLFDGSKFFFFYSHLSLKCLQSVFDWNAFSFISNIYIICNHDCYFQFYTEQSKGNLTNFLQILRKMKNSQLYNFKFEKITLERETDS